MFIPRGRFRGRRYSPLMAHRRREDAAATPGPAFRPLERPRDRRIARVGGLRDGALSGGADRAGARRAERRGHPRAPLAGPARDGAGLDALFTSAPLTIQTNPDRLGLPVLGSLLSGVGVSPWRLMYVTAAVAAAVVACSAWGLARAVIEPRWAGPIYAVAVVSSIPFALTSRAYLDNALAEGMILAVAAAALLSAERRGATLAGVVLLGGTLVMHWPTGTLLVAVLTLFTVGLIPAAWADRRAGKPLISTSAARVGTIAVGGLGVGGIPLLPLRERTRRPRVRERCSA